MTLLALLFAALIALFMPGEGRIIATGFVLAGAAFLGYALLARTYSSASARVLMAVGFDPAGVEFPDPYRPRAPIPVDNPDVDPFADPFGPTTVQQPPRGVAVVSFDQFVRAGNAIGVIIMGLLGTLVGTFAARIVRHAEPPLPGTREKM
jgi:hypothetical protein